MSNNGFGLAVETVVSPIIMLLIFTFLFGGAMAGSVSGYIQYLLPGILVLTVVQSILMQPRKEPLSSTSSLEWEDII